MLEGLRHAVGDSLRGQGLEGIRVAEDHFRLVKGPGQVFAGGEIHGGLAPHGGIGRGQEGGGELDVVHAPLVGGGGEARHVPGDAAPQSGHAVNAGEVLLRQKLQDIGQGVKVLALLPGGKNAGADLKASGFQAGFDRLQIQGGHVAVGHHRHAAQGQDFSQTPAALRQEAGADGHVIFRDGADMDGLHGNRSFQLPPAAAFSSRPSFSRSWSRRASRSFKAD